MVTAKLKDKEALLSIMLLSEYGLSDELEELFKLKISYLKEKEKLLSSVDLKVITLFNRGFTDGLPKTFVKKAGKLEEKRQDLNNRLHRIEKLIPNLKERCPYAYEF
jgi:hypothetical protein